MIEVGSTDEARLLLVLQSRILSDSAKLAFAFLHLNFARLPGCTVETEAHGNVSSLRVRDNGEWSYSISTAHNWILAYVRPPEYRKRRLTLDNLVAHLPDARDRGDEHLLVRLYSIDEAETFLELIRQSRL